MNSVVTDGTTFVNPIGLAFTLLMGLLIILLPRRYALLPVIALICYMTMGMRIIVAGLNFTMIRILLLFGWARLILRWEFKPIKLNPIDKMLLLWTISSIVTYTLLWQDYAAFKYKLGLAYDAVGFYFMFRFLIKGLDEIVRILKMYAILIVPLAVLMMLEKLSGTNSFAVFGGVPATTVWRDGALRCQGPFAHPILAGTFGATLMPMFVGLWWQGSMKRVLAVLAIISAAIVTVASASSGPVLAFLSGILALSLWPLHTQMREIRWGIVLALVGLQAVMKAPIWFLMARVNVFAGSTGYHRAYLLDRAIRNLPDWWLIGTKSTAAWADKDAHLFDVTNQYIAHGADGGLITMFLFIAIIVYCFRGIGRAMHAKDGRKSRKMLWAMGAALFVHVATFMSVTYFDQNFVNWYLLLAMISTVTGHFLLVKKPAYALSGPLRTGADLRSHPRWFANHLSRKNQGLRRFWCQQGSRRSSSREILRPQRNKAPGSV